MLLPRLGSLLFVASTALAFKDTSPFFLLSSDPLPQDAPLRSDQLALTKDVEDRLIDTLSACDRKSYYIFSQDHVSAGDFKDAAMPRLQQRVAGAGERSVIQIPEVVVMGQLSAGSVAARLEKACSAQEKTSAKDYQVVRVDLPALPSGGDERAQAVRDTDMVIESRIASAFEAEESAVFIYITTPPTQGLAHMEGESQVYEMDDPYPSALHTDLKRDVAAHKRQSSDNDNAQAGLPLFEKYQFLSPALFMGLGVSLLLLVILYVGVSAIAGLEVSYAAFSKEMGPQAQKGKQQ